MGTSEVESFVAVANMFLGQTDSPILVSKYLGQMTDSEVMVVPGFRHGQYVRVHIGRLYGPWHSHGVSSDCQHTGAGGQHYGGQDASAPDRGGPGSGEALRWTIRGNNTNVIEAVAEGAVTGMQMALSIGASLVAMVALVAAVNKLLGVCGISLQQVFSYVFAPSASSWAWTLRKYFWRKFLGSKLVSMNSWRSSSWAP